MSPERKGLALGGLLVRRLLEAGVLALVFAAAFRWPAASGNGVVEALAALLFPPLLMEGLLRGRSPWWSLLALFGGFALLFHWVPATLAAKGNLALPVAFAGALLLAVYEAAGLLLVALLARWGARRRGPWAAGLCAALRATHPARSAAVGRGNQPHVVSTRFLARKRTAIHGRCCA